MTTTIENERHEIKACLSCVLPECIPDHPLCPVSGFKTDLEWDRSICLCTYCSKGILIETDRLMVPFFFQCSSTGDNTSGYKTHCRWFWPKPGMTEYQRRKHTGGGPGATRYHAVHAVHGTSGNTE